MAKIQCTVQRSSWYKVYFEYSYTQDKVNAKTTVTHALKLEQLTDYNDFNTLRSVTMSYKVAGTTFSKTGVINIDDKGNTGYTITLASGTSTITHNSATGKGSFSVLVDIKNSASDTGLDSGGYGPGNVYLSKTVDLPTIYRASVPSVGREDGGLLSTATMGSKVYIYTNRKSSSFTHTLKYDFGPVHGVTINTGVGASYEWKIPDLAQYCDNATSGECTITCITYNGSTKVGEETCEVTLKVPEASSVTATNVAMGNKTTVSINSKASNFTHSLELWFAGERVSTTTARASASMDVPLTLAKKIPSDTEGTATIKCTTYNGTAVVGTVKTCEFTATVPKNDTTRPTASWTITPTANYVPAGMEGLYIQGRTGVKVDFSASSAYSTISSYKMSVDGKTYTGDPATSYALNTPGNVVVNGTVTDARGYTRGLQRTISVLHHSTPIIEPTSGYNRIICERSLQDGTYDDTGTYLHINCKVKHSPITVSGADKNICTLSFAVKPEGGSYGAVTKLFDTTDRVGIDTVRSDLVNDVTKSYTVKLIVEDTIGSSEVYEFKIPTADVTLHLAEGGNGVAIGKYSEATPSNRMFEVAFDSHFDGDVYGNAYGLGKLTPIPNNANLNAAEYREFGCYAITQNAIAETLSNLPPYITPRAGILRVYSPTGSGKLATGWVYVAQEYTPFNAHGCYRRLLHRDGTDVEWEADEWVAVGGVDSVIESGQITSSSGVVWQYRKWFNGTAECWARRSVDVDATTSWGSGNPMYYGTVSNTALPFTFASPPVCHICVEKGTTSSSNAFFVASSGQATNATAPSVLLCRPTSATGINVNVLYQVHGLWK